MSPGYVIVHGAGEGGIGRALGAFQQTREIEIESRRREDEYQTNKKIAERQMQLAEMGNVRADRGLALAEQDQAFGQAQAKVENAQRSAESNSAVRLNDARAKSYAQEYELQAQSAEQQREMDKRRIAAIDKGLDEEQALGMFQSMEAAGIDLREDAGMREGIKAAGKVLGGGIGQALALIGNATPTAQQVFQRLPAEYRGRYIADLAEEHKLQRMEIARSDGTETIARLEELGIMSPEDGLAASEAIAAAEDEPALRAALEPIFGAQRRAEVKANRESKRAFTLAKIDDKIATKMADPDTDPKVLDDMRALRTKLELDGNPDFDSYEMRIKAASGGGAPQGRAEEAFPTPQYGGGGQPIQQPIQQPVQQQSAAPPRTSNRKLIEAELRILKEQGFLVDGSATPEQVAEGDRKLIEERAKAFDAAKKYVAYERKRFGSTPGYKPGANALRYVGVSNKAQGIEADDKLTQAFVEHLTSDTRIRAQAALKMLRNKVDATWSDERIMSAMIDNKPKIAEDREDAREILEYLRGPLAQEQRGEVPNL